MSQKISYLFIALILAISFLLMLSVSRQESAIMDELAHIPAGYSYLRYLDYRLNPEHPPLVKILSAVPLIFMNLNFPINQNSWAKDINGQWEAGNQFIYRSGNDADQIIFWARLGPIILALLLTFLIYIWAKELLGERWALLPALFFGLSPAVLAHGHYVTTDIGAALGVVAATYFFIKFFHKPSAGYLIFAGLTFGLAQLMKFSAVLLIPYFVFLTLIWVIRNLSAQAGGKFWKKFLSLAAIFLIGYLLVYLVYFVFTLNYPVAKQVVDAESVLISFKYQWLADFDIFLAGNKFLRPLAHYFLGLLMVFQRSASGNTAYFLGQVSGSGWWYYFPAVFLLKEPLPSLILIGLVFIFGVWMMLKNKNYKLKAFNDYLGTHFSEFSMLVFIIFYWLYSINSQLNIGFRHIIPTLPFIYILTAGGLKNWVNTRFPDYSLKLGLIFILIFWFLFELAWAYPYYLSYFNQLAGGTENGYRIVTDSNYDWGQDLKRLKDWADKNLPIGQVAVDYFGGGDVQYYLRDKAELWQSARGNPKDIGIEWLAVSVNTLQGSDGYRWLPRPDFKAGTSIFIYHL
jgi:4-amino-4-deoxy-L-arabinose transferase-like glycosyltransferase